MCRRRRLVSREAQVTHTSGYDLLQRTARVQPLPLSDPNNLLTIVATRREVFHERRKVSTTQLALPAPERKAFLAKNSLSLSKKPLLRAANLPLTTCDWLVGLQVSQLDDCRRLRLSAAHSSGFGRLLARCVVLILLQRLIGSEKKAALLRFPEGGSAGDNNWS